jgi:hypothetical protein
VPFAVWARAGDATIAAASRAQPTTGLKRMLK